jgi:hypothetical protein
MTANVHIHHLSEIVSDRKRADAKNSRRSLFEACRTVAGDLGDDLAGYAVVVWGKDGELRSVYEAGQGPIKPALIPTLAGDALNRHVALDMAPPAHKG